MKSISLTDSMNAPDILTFALLAYLRVDKLSARFACTGEHAANMQVRAFPHRESRK